jgi:glucuronate isomerase
MYFNVNELISEKTAKLIWDKCNKVINSDCFSARYLIESSKVQLIGTTDDPLDDLKYHQLIASDKTFNVKVLPSFRPDKAVDIDKATFMDYLVKLGHVVGYKLDSVEKIVSALTERITYFNQNGCKLSDHGLDYMPYGDANLIEVESILTKKLNGETITFEEVNKYKTVVLVELGKKYNEYNWVMQLHIGAMRNNNTKMFNLIGPDTGFDSINDYPVANQVSKFLNKLEFTDQLPKTILYTLNPRDNYVLASMVGNFMTSGIPGKIQFGSGWWYNDQKSGMLDQMITLASVGLLSNFVGMLTDSRSFLSYARHDYFRRILCNLIGTWVEDGEVPNDLELLGNMVQDISFNNACNFILKL